MRIFDTHCDVLLKLQLGKRLGKEVSFRKSTELDAGLTHLKAGGVKVQFFAIFIDPVVPSTEKWQHALEQIDLFYEEVLGKNPEMRHITSWKDLDTLKEDEIGAVLTLEGADAFGNDLGKLRHLFRLGVKSVGLTWNNANLCADGAMETRGGGLTLFGKKVIAEMNRFGILADVSHLCVNSFWDVVKLADYPFASHSNARALYEHPRNLHDDQIKALFDKGGMIHLVFHPRFVRDEGEDVSVADFIKHIKHLYDLGGADHIGFGSDFEGISEKIIGLEDASTYPHFIKELQGTFTDSDIEKIAYKNFLEHYAK